MHLYDCFLREGKEGFFKYVVVTLFGGAADTRRDSLRKVMEHEPIQLIEKFFSKIFDILVLEFLNCSEEFAHTYSLNIGLFQRCYKISKGMYKEYVFSDKQELLRIYFAPFINEGINFN